MEVREVVQKFVSFETKEETVAYMDELVADAIKDNPELPIEIARQCSVELLEESFVIGILTSEFNYKDAVRVMNNLKGYKEVAA